MSAFFVPTRFTWRFGGSVVHLCGSFTRWVETVPMGAVEGQPGSFTVVVHLPPGYHQYKFIVDGEWRHDETQPYMPDPLGNVNNWLFVRRMEQQQQQQPTQGRIERLQILGLNRRSRSGNWQLRVPIPHSGLHGNHLHPLLQMQQGQSPQQMQQGHSQSQGSMQTAMSQPPTHSLPAASQDNSGAGGRQASMHSDVEMATESSIDSLQSPIVTQVEEPAYTRKRVREFLNNHTCYELIPESGKVVLLDMDLPVRQAFHALHEQGVASAPLWDSNSVSVVGMISASDFIHVLRRLRSNVSSGANPMSEAEMDAHTIRGMREQGEADGRPPKRLVALAPVDNMQQVINHLFRNRCSMAPVLTCDAHVDFLTAFHQKAKSACAAQNPFRASFTKDSDVPLREQLVIAAQKRRPAHSAAAHPAGHNQAGGQNEGNVNTLLHIATISGMLASLMRHFRASLSSLPLLAQPVENLPIGTWSSSSQLQPLEGTFSDCQGEERRDRRKIRQLHSVQPNTPLTTALSLLLEAGISVLPVVDEEGRLLDMYARSDITALAKGNSYSRLQWEEVTVGQALSLAQQPNQSWPQISGGEGVQGNAAKPQRVHLCSPRDTLRSVVERLTVPGVRRLFVVQPDTLIVWGILSLSDVAAFLCDVI